MAGLLATERRSIGRWLVDSDRSLLRQSNADPEQLQGDGWGVAWYDGNPAPSIVKGIHPAYEAGEVDRFREAGRHAIGTLTVAHLRRASNPMGLSRDQLIGLENSQPFLHEGYAFAHNGSIRFPRETRSLLGRFEASVVGVNDSEVLFWLLMRHLDGGRAPVEAFSRAVSDLVEVWQRQGAPTIGPFSGLNVLLSKGPSELWAFCLYRGEHGSALLDDHRPYYELAYSAEPSSLLIASEPLESGRARWQNLSNGQYLHAEASNGKVGVDVGRIPLVAPVPA